MAHPTFPMKAPDAQHCNARRLKHNAYCTRPAGWGTPHLGSGRCKLHGGSAHVASITHGRYSTLVQERIKSLYEQYKADPDPLNMLDELHMARAIMVDFINRYEEFSQALLDWHESYLDPEKAPAAKPRQILDISHAMSHVEVITRIIERLEKLRSEGAVSREELSRILWEMRRGMELHVSDEKTRDRIVKAWGTIGLR